METIKEILENKLASLGEAMFLLLSGKELSSEQLTLIKNSTEKQKKFSAYDESSFYIKGTGIYELLL